MTVSPGGVSRFQNSACVFVDGDSAGGEFDEPLCGFAVGHRACEHAADDGVAHGALIFGGQTAVVQQLR